MEKKKSEYSESLGEILYEFVHQSSWKKDFDDSKAVIYYNQIQNDLLLNFSRAYQFADNTLFIYVKSPIHSNEIGMLSEKIINLLNNRLKQRLIYKLKFKVGDYLRPDEEINNNEDPIKNISLNDNELNEIQKELNDVSDKEILESLNELYSSILKKRKLDG